MTDSKAITSAIDASLPISPRLTRSNLSSRPGALRGDVTLTLQTASAQALLQGRPKTGVRSGIVGLFAFAHATRSLARGAGEGDPYAAWWLCRIEQALDDASADLTRLLAAFHAKISTCSALQISPAESVAPCVTLLQFSTSHAFRGARLLAEYDDVVRRVLSARHASLVSTQDGRIVLYQAGRAVRRAFASVTGFVATGVRWSDLRSASPRLAYAAQKMGPLPASILTGAELPRDLPTGMMPPASEAPSDPDVAVIAISNAIDETEGAMEAAETGLTADSSDFAPFEADSGAEEGQDTCATV